MADRDPDVKPDDGPGAPALTLYRRLVKFCEDHGKLGWYLALFGICNMMLNILDLLIEVGIF